EVVDLGAAAEATHVEGAGHVHAGNEDGDVLDVAGRGKLGDEAALEHVLTHCALHVHDRGFTANGDRLLEPPHPHLGVDGGGEAARELHAVALHRGEAGEREVDPIAAGWQI